MILPHHQAQLEKASGLPAAVIRERGYRSVSSADDLARLGFTPPQRRVPGLLVPVWGPDGRNGLYQFRPDEPRTSDQGKSVKYETPSGARLHLDVPPRCREHIADPKVPLWITEGVKKADALAANGFCGLALLGVWNWRGTNAQGGKVALPDWHDVALNGREVVIAYDSDVMRKREVRAALDELTRYLQGKGANARWVFLPDGAGGAKVGVDDYLLEHSPDELRALVRPAPNAAATASSPAPTKSDGDYERKEARLEQATSTLAALADRYSTTVGYLAPPYIGLGALTEVVGPPESLKSWLMADLARAVHTGTRWLGSIEVPQGRVLFFEQERARNLTYQMHLLAAGWEQDLRGITTVEPCGIDLCDEQWQRAIIAMVEAERPLLVVFNSYRAVFRGRPPDSADVALALGWLGHLAERLQLAVVIVDATNKAGATGHVRGMAAQADSLQKAYEADTILHIERKRDNVGRGVGPARAYLGKERYGTTTPPPFVFDVVPVAPSSSSLSSPSVSDNDDDPSKGHVAGPVRVLWLDEAHVEADVPAPPHNAPERVLRALPADGSTCSIDVLAKAAGLAPGSAKNALTQLKAEGKAENPGRGQWRLSPPSSSSSSPSPTHHDDDDDPPSAAPAQAEGQACEGDTPGAPVCEEGRRMDALGGDRCTRCDRPAQASWHGEPRCFAHHPLGTAAGAA